MGRSPPCQSKKKKEENYLYWKGKMLSKPNKKGGGGVQEHNIAYLTITEGCGKGHEKNCSLPSPCKKKKKETLRTGKKGDRLSSPLPRTQREKKGKKRAPVGKAGEERRTRLSWLKGESLRARGGRKLNLERKGLLQVKEKEKGFPI